MQVSLAPIHQEHQQGPEARLLAAPLQHIEAAHPVASGEVPFPALGRAVRSEQGPTESGPVSAASDEGVAQEAATQPHLRVHVLQAPVHERSSAIQTGARALLVDGDAGAVCSRGQS